MAYNPTQMFPGAVDLTDPDFVNGKYKDSSAPGVLDGTPLQAIYFNQRLSMEQAFMDEAGEVYSNSADDPSDSQIATAIKKTYQAINKIKTSQFVVEGTTGDPLPSTTPTDYLVGAEIAFGWVVTSDCEQIVVDSNGNITSNNNVGVIEHTFDKADNGTPNAASLFASVMRCTDAANSTYVQDYADGSNGISLVNETATTITMRIDFSSFAGGKVFGVSEQLGRLEILGSDEAFRVPTVGKDEQLFLGSLSSGNVTVKNLNNFKYIFFSAVFSKGGTEVEYYTQIEVDRLLNGVGQSSVFDVTDAGTGTRFANLAIDRTTTTSTNVAVTSGSSADTWNNPRLTEIRGIY